MKNKLFLPIFLLFAVNNLQFTAERFKIIAAREFAELVRINELKKKLELLDKKAQRTEEIIYRCKASIAAHDIKIQHEIAELEKDEERDYIRIANLKAMMSNRVSDGTLKLSKERLSITDKFFYYTRYKNPRISIIGLPLLVGGAYVVNLLKNKMQLLSLEDSQEQLLSLEDSQEQ